MRLTARLGSGLVIALLLAACARVEVATFQPAQGQQTLVRDGVPVIYSRQRQSLVLVRPALRQFRAGKRPTYVLALYNLTNQPLQFAVANLHVAQVQDGQAKYLKVYTYDELVNEEHTRQAIQGLALGLAAAGNSMSAASAGHYNATATVSGPNGFSTVNVHGYDPTAAAVAQNQAAAQNEAMISTTVETGQRNLVNLEQTVIKDDALLPGEWYGGTMQFDAPSGSAAKNCNITVQIGDDTHQISVIQAPRQS